ncbi:hypothetical protein FAZ69_11295 [Trinickia terrae]|uniref:Uncharacterized protein n=1 Tax=Trinickia terrae TaxID=2571161 RepID=A0A4U1I8B7_9BURK|nr:hypothetical protein [Trinickia terrae]TKC89505.1 hypothetical protein FAZ69_11295 [Trinickia terrae]
MKKLFLTASTIAVLATSASLALAEDLPGMPPPGGEHAVLRYDASAAPLTFPRSMVINDLEQLHRLYAITGREDDIVGVYHDVLKETQDPAIRNYVYDSLARVQLKPAHADDAIATLRASLTEDLSTVNKRSKN